VSTYRERAGIDPPYRLLALDGGGIRGVLTLEVLKQVEATLRVETGDQKLVLADWFDYVGGTSTGAIIAAGLARGMTVDEISGLYDRLGKKLFTKSFLPKRFWSKFRAEPVSEALKKAFGERTTLGDDSLRTLLMIVLRSAGTDSPWPLSNNPAAKYNDLARPDANLNLPLWRLVRGSTAAPTFFPAERMHVGDTEFVFQDGGVTSYNNPAFQLFLMATLDAYRLGWQTGADKMLLVSVGTGFHPDANQNLKLSKLHLYNNAKSIPSALMFAAQVQQDVLCRSVGHTVVGDWIDRELQALMPASGVVPDPLFTYMRFNANLSAGGLQDLGLTDVDPDGLARLDSVDRMADLRAVGRAVARKVDGAHFRPFLQPVRR